MPAPPPLPDLAGLSLAEIARLAEAKTLPPVESWNPDALRRQRHAHRARRHLVPRGHADRPAGDGAAVLDHPAARGGRQLCAGHAGREARHRGRGRAVRRGRDEERGRRPAIAASPSASTPAIWSSPGPSTRCALPRARTARAPIFTSAAASRRWSRGRSITSWPSSRSPRPPTPPGLWSDGAFFPLEPAA